MARLLTVFVVAVLLPLIVPYAASLGVGGRVLRLVFPVYVLSVSAALVSSRRWLYPTFAIAVFAYAAFLRRVADNSAGFELINPILIAPYLGLVPSLPSLLRRVLGQRPGPVWPFAVFVFCAIYGVFVALLNDSPLMATVFDATRWVLPISLCAFVLDAPGQHEAIRRSVVTGLLFILPILAAYGIYQYIVAPPWDVFWMVNIDNATFGIAEPYQIRVFSMMNSPFSVAAFSAMAMTMLAGEGLLGIAVAGFALPMLGLTLVRAAWVGLAAGLMALTLNATASRKLVLLLGSLGVGFLCVALLASPVVSPFITKAISDRLSTFTDLQADPSGETRLNSYDSFYSQLADSPMGKGFGINQSMLTATSKHGEEPLDSGVLETMVEFGVVVGTAYFVAFGALILQTVLASRRSPRRLAGAAAVTLAGTTMLFLGAAQIGEVGVLQWAALGIVLASAAADQPPRRTLRLRLPPR